MVNEIAAFVISNCNTFAEMISTYMDRDIVIVTKTIVSGRTNLGVHNVTGIGQIEVNGSFEEVRKLVHSCNVDGAAGVIFALLVR